MPVRHTDGAMIRFSKPASFPPTGSKPAPVRSGGKVATRTSIPSFVSGLVCFALTIVLGFAATAEEPTFPPLAHALFKQFCFDCHNTATAEGQVNLEQMSARPAFNTAFKKWEKVTAIVHSERMPPKDAEQPTPEQRGQLIRLVRG